MWVTAENKSKIDFAPSSIEAEVVQNVRTILAQPKYNVPYAVELAQDTDMLDKPIQIAKALSASNTVQAIKRYEPRAIITEIKFTGDGSTGLLKPTVRIRIDE